MEEPSPGHQAVELMKSLVEQSVEETVLVDKDLVQGQDSLGRPLLACSGTEHLKIAFGDYWLSGAAETVADAGIAEGVVTVVAGESRIGRSCAVETVVVVQGATFGCFEVVQSCSLVASYP